MSANAGGDNASPTSSIRPPAALHYPVRPTWSCTECIRRKTKCSKTIPCDGCTKRGIEEHCKRGDDGRQRKEAVDVGNRPLEPIVARLLRRVDRLERLQRESAAVRTDDAAVPASSASTLLSPPPDSRATPPAESINDDADDAAADNQETSVTIEYLALGKNRRLGILGSSRDPHTATAPTTNILDTPHSVKMPRVIAQVWPASRTTIEAVLAFHRTAVLWQHACIHSHTFDRQVRALYGLDPRLQWSKVDTLWLALLLSIHVIALHQMPQKQVTALYPGHNRQALVDSMLAAALRCLELGNYMLRPSFFTCQAIAVLSVCGHNVVDSNMLASLLAVGIKTAQTLNLHVLGAEAERVEAEFAERHFSAAAASDGERGWTHRLVALEMGKRVWWSLVQQDYFAIPFRGVSLVHPRQHDTPFPLNVLDDDLQAGHLSPVDDFALSLILKQRITSMSADVLCRFFDKLPKVGATLAEHVTPFQRALSRLLPKHGFLALPGDTPQRYAHALTQYLNISVRHKMLVIHRAYCGRAPRSKADAAQSQAACVELAREVLTHCRVGTAATEDGEEALLAVMWTTAYHAVAAATVLALDMFAHANSTTTATARRAEVEEARAALQDLAQRSPIAARGVTLLTSLLAQFDQAVHGMQSASQGGGGGGGGGDVHRKKRAKTADGNDAPTRSDDHQRGSYPVGEQPEWEVWDLEQYQAIVSMLDAMPDVGRLFDGSLGDPFASGTVTF